MTAPLVSVILVSWNTRALTEAAISTFRAQEKTTALEFIIVDNASTDGSAEHLENVFPDARVIRSPVNEGFARGNNRGVEAAIGQYVLLLNTDTVAHEEILPACLAALKSYEPAILGCRLLNADGTLQLSAEKFPRLRDLAREVFKTTETIQRDKLLVLPPGSHGPTRVDWLCGAFLLMNRESYLSLGGLSPAIFMYGEDVEFCWRAARVGIRSLYLPDVSITHLGGGGVNHGSYKSLMLSDSGRLRSFELMRGKSAAFFLRLILMARSALRIMAWGLPGLAAGDSERIRKSLNHGRELLFLAGFVGKER